MRDYQKSLDSLRDKSTRGLGSLIVSAGCDKDVDDYDKVLNNLQELVDKEKPKPLIHIEQYDEDWYVCPECGEMIIDFDYIFCPYCKQRLKEDKQ